MKILMPSNSYFFRERLVLKDYESQLQKHFKLIDINYSIAFLRKEILSSAPIFK